jgi:hypothetical protein
MVARRSKRWHESEKLAGPHYGARWQGEKFRRGEQLDDSWIGRRKSREPESTMKLRHCGDNGALVRVEPIAELIADIFAALP